MIVGQEAPDARHASASATPSSSATSTRAATTSRRDKSVFEEITGGAEFIKVGARELPARAYVSSFNFRGTDQQKPVGTLSGGERNRVHLAKLLKSGGNVLLLDEPTNDLDVDTLRALEAGLESFPGCAVVISHDRWFLDRIATHVLAFEGDSEVRWFEGNFTEYEEFRHRELGTAADQPHRIRYKKLARADALPLPAPRRPPREVGRLEALGERGVDGSQLLGQRRPLGVGRGPREPGQRPQLGHPRLDPARRGQRLASTQRPPPRSRPNRGAGRRAAPHLGQDHRRRVGAADQLDRRGDQRQPLGRPARPAARAGVHELEHRHEHRRRHHPLVGRHPFA